MKIKLEITSQTLTPKQKGLITEKLEEIRAIVKNKETKPNSRAGRTIEKFFNKLRYENEKVNPQTSWCASVHPAQNSLLEGESELTEQCHRKAPQDTPHASFPEKKHRQNAPTKLLVSVYHFQKEGKKYVCKENAGLTLPLTRPGKPDLEQLPYEILFQKRD